MKTIFYILIGAVIALQSCVYETHTGRDGQDGQSFFKMNYTGGEPSFVDAGGVIPDNFRWDSYYNTYPGNYVINYEYEEYNGYEIIIYPFEIEVEVYNFEGEPGDYNYDGRDGDDVYFEVVLSPDGYEYYEDIHYKSDSIIKSKENVTERTAIGVREDIKNDVRIVYKYYKLPQRVLKNK